MGNFMMKKYRITGMIGLLLSFMLLSVSLHAQVSYPYSSGQAVFVQSPYNSSLYTNYNYNQHESAPQRLPAYTTNQAVFVQQPYATTPQTVTSYPSINHDNLFSSENRYTSPTAYPSTVEPIYPYATVGEFPASPYTTTNQAATYHYPYSTRSYTITDVYPYTTATQVTAYPTTIIEKVPNARTTNTYNAYPVTTVSKYPYPVTTTAAPEFVIEPPRPPPAQQRFGP